MDFSKYLNIPFKEKGYDSSGCDCYGLIVYFYKNELGITLPTFEHQYATVKDRKLLANLISKNKKCWNKVETPNSGDVILFRILNQPCHIGISVDKSHFLHITASTHSVIESLDGNMWKPRIVGYYRYEK